MGVTLYQEVKQMPEDHDQQSIDKNLDLKFKNQIIVELVCHAITSYDKQCQKQITCYDYILQMLKGKIN